MPDDAVIDALADEYWHFVRATAQLWNVDRGDVGQIEHWEDLSPAGLAERAGRLAGFARRAEELGSGGFVDPGSDHDVLVAAVGFNAGATAAALPYDRDLALVAGPFNVAVYLSVLVPAYHLVTADHGEGYVAKLRGLPAFVGGWIEGLREGAACGRTATARGVADVVAAVDRLLAATPGDHPLAAQAPPTGLDPPAAAAWRGRVVRAVEEAVQPALAHLRAVLRDELLPVARVDERPGLCHLEGGRGDYERLLWASTSLPVTADAVHDLGLEQLAALDGEYRTLGPDCVGTADPVEVRERLRSDPTLRYASVAEILTDARATLARAETEAGRWFLRLPRAACTARALTTGPAAFYTGPSPDGFRGGTFFLNAADPSSWSRYQLEATAFHEGVPGHHLQVALGQELRLHPVLGELEVDSFSEGWGLYAERLADEMGLYSTPLQRLGMVTLDSMRAARLVVDTGLHDRGWTRSEAVEFMFGRTAQPRASVVAEVDRYIADAGQAVSYLVGRQELRRLRDGAERALGDRFDIRSFHDRVLRHGMAPFPALARSLDAWAGRAGARPP